MSNFQKFSIFLSPILGNQHNIVTKQRVPVHDMFVAKPQPQRRRPCFFDRLLPVSSQAAHDTDVGLM